MAQRPAFRGTTWPAGFGSVVPATPGFPSGGFVDIYNTQTVGGAKTFTNTVTITRAAQAGVAESLLSMGVSDTGSAGYNFLNRSAVDGVFAPRVLFRPTAGEYSLLDSYGASDTPGQIMLRLAGSNAGAALASASPVGFYNGSTLLAYLDAAGNYLLRGLGAGLAVREGANCKQGVATLVAGTVTVANTSITASSRVQLTAQDNNATGALRVSARVAGTSFTITSSNAGDTGVVAYEIFEPS